MRVPGYTRKLKSRTTTAGISMQTLDLIDYFRLDFDVPDPRPAQAPWPRVARIATEPGIAIARTEADRHAARTAPDDHSGPVLVATRQRRTLASLRLVHAADATGEAGLAALRDTVAPHHLAGTVLHQVAMAPGRPGRALVERLFRQAYRTAILAGGRTGLIAAVPVLRDLLVPLGWRATGAGYRDPVAGDVVILRLDLFDLERLRAAGSPLLQVAEDLLRSAERLLYDGR